MQITDSLFHACCLCPYKAFLQSKCEVGKVLEYEAIQAEADARFRELAIERLVATHTGGIILRDPPSLTAAIEQGAGLILGATVNALDGEHKIEVLERHLRRGSDGKAVYVPITFSHRNKLNVVDSLLAAFRGIIFAEALGQPVPLVKLVHGPDFSVTRVKLVSPSGSTQLIRRARQTLDRRKQTRDPTTPPLMVLNDHCHEC